jgi:hypothetical protein
MGKMIKLERRKLKPESEQLTISEADKRRFLEKLANAVAVEGPLETLCLEWAYAINGKGYGSFRIGDHVKPAHRVAWQILKGEEIPPGLYCLHICDNSLCVNVEHLFLGTQQDNVEDCIAKGRGKHSDFFGENHGQAKLTEDQVFQIHEMAWSGMYLQWEIARMFDIDRSAISLIKLKKCWKHLWQRPQRSTPQIKELTEGCQLT